MMTVPRASTFTTDGVTSLLVTIFLTTTRSPLSMQAISLLLVPRSIPKSMVVRAMLNRLILSGSNRNNHFGGLHYSVLNIDSRRQSFTDYFLARHQPWCLFKQGNVKGHAIMELHAFRVFDFHAAFGQYFQHFFNAVAQYQMLAVIVKLRKQFLDAPAFQRQQLEGVREIGIWGVPLGFRCQLLLE